MKFRLPEKRAYHIWNDEDIRILKFVYPIGGVRAVQSEMQAHDRPYRSSANIRIKAKQLGLRYQARKDRL